MVVVGDGQALCGGFEMRVIVFIFSHLRTECVIPANIRHLIV